MLRLSRLHKPKHELKGERIQRVLSCFNFTARKIGGTVAFCLIIIVSLVANCLILILFCKKAELKKNQQIVTFFIANVASSNLLYTIFSIPFNLSDLHTNSWLIGGQLNLGPVSRKSR